MSYQFLEIVSFSNVFSVKNAKVQYHWILVSWMCTMSQNKKCAKVKYDMKSSTVLVLPEVKSSSGIEKTPAVIRFKVFCYLDTSSIFLLFFVSRTLKSCDEPRLWERLCRERKISILPPLSLRSSFFKQTEIEVFVGSSQHNRIPRRIFPSMRCGVLKEQVAKEQDAAYEKTPTLYRNPNYLPMNPSDWQVVLNEIPLLEEFANVRSGDFLLFRKLKRPEENSSQNVSSKCSIL